MVLLIVAVMLILAFSYLGLRGENLSYLDSNIIPRPAGEPSDAHHDVVASLKTMQSERQGARGKKRIQMLRVY